ncbi:MAG TPA: ABC transporter substrate-binding protein [bacterium]|nr:ABC transporter substrate-binding protein [bacterium]
MGIASLALAVGGGLALTGTAEAAGKPIKIGYVGGITGACAGLTSYAVKAMKLATEEINKGGGVMGRPLEVIYRDSKTKPDEGAKQARDLILSEHVDVLTGPCSSSIYMAVAPIAKQYKVPLFSALAGSHRATIDEDNPYVFETQPHTLIEGKALAEYAAKQPWNTIVTMGLDYEWGRVTVQVFVDELKKLKPSVKIAKELWPRVGETNLTSYITAALAEKPDAVMAVMFGGGTVSMIKQGEAYGFLQRTKLLTFLSTEALMSLGPEIPDGVYGWARAPFYALHNAKAKAFIKKYRAAYGGEYPADWGVLAYDAMYIIKDGIEKAHSTNPAKLRNALAGMKFDSLRGPLKMRKLDNTWDSPVFIGVTKKTPEYPFPIMVDVDRISGDLLMPPASVVKELREKAKKS